MNPTTKILLPSLYQAGYTHPVGTPVELVELLDAGELVWLVEVRVPDESLEGGAWYEHFELAAKDLDFSKEIAADRAKADLASRSFDGLPLGYEDVIAPEHTIPRIAA